MGLSGFTLTGFLKMNDYDYEDSEKESDKDDSSDMESEQALLPKSIFPHDPKPGKKCTFEVVSVNGDEIAVKYSSSKGDDDDKKDDDDDDDTVSVAAKDEDEDPFASYDGEDA